MDHEVRENDKPNDKEKIYNGAGYVAKNLKLVEPADFRGSQKFREIVPEHLQETLLNTNVRYESQISVSKTYLCPSVLLLNMSHEVLRKLELLG